MFTFLSRMSTVRELPILVSGVFVLVEVATGIT